MAPGSARPASRPSSDGSPTSVQAIASGDVRCTRSWADGELPKATTQAWYVAPSIAMAPGSTAPRSGTIVRGITGAAPTRRNSPGGCAVAVAAVGVVGGTVGEATGEAAGLAHAALRNATATSKRDDRRRDAESVAPNGFISLPASVRRRP